MPTAPRDPIDYDQMHFGCVRPGGRFEHVIAPGSALVFFEHHLAQPLRPSEYCERTEKGPYLCYYEGNVYKASNMQLFHEKAFHAAGRAHTRYPTASLMMLDTLDHVIVLGRLGADGYPQYTRSLDPQEQSLAEKSIGVDMATLQQQVAAHHHSQEQYQQIKRMMRTGQWR